VIKGLLVLFTLALYSCAPQQIDPLLQPYYNDFMARANAANSYIEYSTPSLIFGQMPEPQWAGYCDLSSHTAVIDPGWKTMDMYSQQELVFHELGHCVLGRMHVLAVLPNTDPNAGNPVSIMYPIMLRPFNYAAMQDYYLQELFDWH